MNSAFDRFERALVEASRTLEGQNAPAPIRETLRRGRGEPRSRRFARYFGNRLAISFALVVCVAGGATAAVISLWPSQPLADGAVNCFWGTSTKTRSHENLESGLSSANGQDAITVCRQDYALNAHTGIPARSIHFVACEATLTKVNVYVSSGAANQCQLAGDKPLPATYAASVKRLKTLMSTLLKLQSAQNCVVPSTLIQEAKATLTRMDLTGWRVRGPFHIDGFPAGTGGTCGTFDAGFANAHDTLNFISAHQEVFVDWAPPRSISTKLNHIEYELYTRTYEHCYTATSARALVRQWFATINLKPLFATTARPKQGGIYEPASEKLYRAGCVRFSGSAAPTDDNQHVDVVLFAKTGVPEPGSILKWPATSDFLP
jgi:hypothetical protein